MLQEDIRASRAASTRSDTARQRQADSIGRAMTDANSRNTARLETTIRGLEATVRVQNDSMRRLSQRLDSLRYRMVESQGQMGKELQIIENLVGALAKIPSAIQSQLEDLQRRVQQDNERLRASLSTPPSVDTLGAAAAPPGAAGMGTSGAIPGPNTLSQEAHSLLVRQNCTSGRRTYQTLISTYPDDPLVPEAWFGVADSFYRCEHNPTPADSIYDMIVKKYPRSDSAPRALYAQGLIKEESNRLGEARSVFERLVRDYPGSETARMACATKLSRSNC